MQWILVFLKNEKRVFAISKLDGEPFNFDLLKHRPLKPLGNFLEVTTDQKYLVTQPSMLSKIRSKSSLANGFSGRLEVVNDFVYTITTRQDRCPNSGLIEYEKNKYRILTEKECWRLMGFDDDDFNNAKKQTLEKRKVQKYGTLSSSGKQYCSPCFRSDF